MKSFIYFCLFLAVTISPAFAEDAQVQELERYVQSLRTARNDVVNSYNHFEKTLHTKDVLAASTQLQELQQLVNASIQQLEKMDSYQQEGAYRTSVLDFMQYMQRITHGSVVDILAIYKLQYPTAEDQKRIEALYIEYTTDAAKRIKACDAAEKVFLQRYNTSDRAVQFCNTIRRLLENATTGFADIKGEKDADSMVMDRYKAKLMAVGALEGWVEDWYFPQVIYTYYQGRDLEQAGNYLENLGKWVDSCELGFKRTDVEVPAAEWETTKGSAIHFTEGNGTQKLRGIKIVATKPATGYMVQVIVENPGLTE